MGKNIFAAKHFHDEAAARAWFEAARWPDGVHCPSCGTAEPYKTKVEGRYRCKAKECRRDFTVMTGTVMERSHAKLTQWAAAFTMAAASKKGFSAHQLHRQLGCQYNTAWFIFHRVREAMRQGGLDLPPMGGSGQIVEADETYFGPVAEPSDTRADGMPFKRNPRYRHNKGGKFAGTANKRAIVTLVERGGKVRSFHVPRADKATVAKIVRENIHHESRLHTDESGLYKGADQMFAAHETVNHTMRYAPANVCIYCDATEPLSKLTKEHIVPYSLGGTYLLPKASCLKCAEATKRLEGYAGRHIFQDVRIEHGFPTNNPLQRPTHIEMRLSAPSSVEAPIRLIPTKDCVDALMLTIPEPAGIIVGRSPEKKIAYSPFVRQIGNKSRVENLKAQGIDTNIRREIRADLIMRLVAKCALGFGVASCGLEGFSPDVRELILKRDVSPYHLVGGTTPEMDQFPPPTNPTAVHKMLVYVRPIEGVQYLAVQLQLFAYLGAPIYTVILGKMTQSGLNKIAS